MVCGTFGATRKKNQRATTVVSITLFSLVILYCFTLIYRIDAFEEIAVLLTGRCMGFCCCYRGYNSNKTVHNACCLYLCVIRLHSICCLYIMQFMSRHCHAANTTRMNVSQQATSTASTPNECCSFARRIICILCSADRAQCFYTPVPVAVFEWWYDDDDDEIERTERPCTLDRFQCCVVICFASYSVGDGMWIVLLYCIIVTSKQAKQASKADKQVLFGAFDASLSRYSLQSPVNG